MPHRLSPTGRLRALVVAGTVTAALAATPSAAQAIFDGDAYAFPVPDYVSGLIGANALQHTYDATTGGSGGSRSGSRRRAAPKPKPPKPPTAAQRATLRFTPTPRVTEKIHDAVAARAGVERETIVPVFVRVTTEWRRVMSRTVGWRPRDLGDTAAFTFLQTIARYRGNGNFNKSGLALIRRAVRDNLAAQPAVRRLSDARKQEAAESLELRMIFFAADLDALAQHGDSAGVTRVRGELRDWSRAIFGVDVAQVKVTRRGLVKR